MKRCFFILDCLFQLLDLSVQAKSKSPRLSGIQTAPLHETKDAFVNRYLSSSLLKVHPVYFLQSARESAKNPSLKRRPHLLLPCSYYLLYCSVIPVQFLGGGNPARRDHYTSHPYSMHNSSDSQVFQYPWSSSRSKYDCFL